MNDTEAMTRVIRNTMNARKEAARPQNHQFIEPDGLSDYLAGIIAILQVIDPADLGTILDNLGFDTIDDIDGGIE